MRIYYVYETAHKVVELVVKGLKKEKSNGEVSIGTYTNGRENGFTITMYLGSKEDYRTLRIWISNQRNSDSLQIVYEDFNAIKGDLFSEEAYKHQNRTFDSDDYKDASEYVLRLAKDEIAYIYKEINK